MAVGGSAIICCKNKKKKMEWQSPFMGRLIAFSNYHMKLAYLAIIFELFFNLKLLLLPTFVKYFNC